MSLLDKGSKLSFTQRKYSKAFGVKGQAPWHRVGLVCLTPWREARREAQESALTHVGGCCCSCSSPSHVFSVSDRSMPMAFCHGCHVNGAKCKIKRHAFKKQYSSNFANENTFGHSLQQIQLTNTLLSLSIGICRPNPKETRGTSGKIDTVVYFNMW